MPSGEDTWGSDAEATGEIIRTNLWEAERERRTREKDQPDPEKRLAEYLRSAYCARAGEESGSGAVLPCGDVPADDDLPECDDAGVLEPLLRRTRATPATPWGPWYVLSDWACAGDLVPAFTAADFRELPLAPPALHVQPARGQVLVHMPTIVYSDDAVQTLETELLGYRFEVQATPSSYRWDFGDGETVTTRTPGRPYPAKDVAHAYRSTGTQRVTLTVTWTGRYRVAGAAGWQDVDGTATTTASTPDFTVVERRSRLVTGTCDDEPDAAGC
ncbi:PKD domain-containing protein [Cellulomonas massiliensis]|uniref:PKD domain-containing protein n=1 Tax=Cellulomonas massiliensis TaxID=1465811 RepID=UPI00037CACA2|nr:PKD domain-containing protein [Cellulomonas massiliensis]